MKYRKTTRKTNSLADRLEEITLPDSDDVADDLDRYVEAKERAEELTRNSSGPTTSLTKSCTSCTD